MTHGTYQLVENYMLSCMKDSAHDKEHIYRVLYNALQIAAGEENVDYDVLICACLLHDVGRQEEFENPGLCHAQVGAQKALLFLNENGFDADFAEQVAHCIRCHRHRKASVLQSLEAKILFDTDKLDVTGAIGIARTLVYKGQLSDPLYTRKEDGQVSDGENDAVPSFFQEYKVKLEKLYDKFYTQTGAELARRRQKHAVQFYHDLLAEVSESDELGNETLWRILSE
ncbi:MAG: HD domain-containing protein [Lachnospiraceae bacterium]|nr:HD domain-containing protein [Lachnospiraceae bacterium]